MAAQVGGRLRRAVTRQIGRRRAHHAAVGFGQGQRNQAGVGGRAVAHREVHRLAEQIGQPVADAHLEADAGMAALEFIQPGQQHVAPQVRGHRDRQRAADGGLVARQRVAAGVQRCDGRAGVLQVALAVRRQPQAARGNGRTAGSPASAPAVSGRRWRPPASGPARARRPKLPWSAADTKILRSSKRTMMSSFSKIIETGSDASRFSHARAGQ